MKKLALSASAIALLSSSVYGSTPNQDSRKLTVTTKVEDQIQLILEETPLELVQHENETQTFAERLFTVKRSGYRDSFSQYSLTVTQSDVPNSQTNAFGNYAMKLVNGNSNESFPLRIDIQGDNQQGGNNEVVNTTNKKAYDFYSNVRINDNSSQTNGKLRAIVENAALYAAKPGDYKANLIVMVQAK